MGKKQADFACGFHRDAPSCQRSAIGTGVRYVARSTRSRPDFDDPPFPADADARPLSRPAVSLIIDREQRLRAEKAMMKSWVKVNGPKDRDVFVDYDFTAPAGCTNEPFQVHSGANTFMLIARNLVIEARTKATIHALNKANPQVIELWPATAPPPQRPRPESGLPR